MAIYISENGFITLTLSAIETSTKYEASGILLGYKVRKTYYIESVIPYQIAERTSNSVKIPPKKRERIKRVFKNYMKYKIIGEFHTHPNGSVKLSKSDKNFINQNGYELEIVVAIDQIEETQSWNYMDKELSGSIDKYFIKIVGWSVEDKKTEKQKIICPFAVGFG